MRNSS